MPLVPGVLATSMKGFITTANAMKQDDAAAAIDNYCKELETVIYDAIKSLTITLPPGSIVVAVSGAAGTNTVPIPVTGAIT